MPNNILLIAHSMTKSGQPRIVFEILKKQSYNHNITLYLTANNVCEFYGNELSKIPVHLQIGSGPNINFNRFSRWFFWPVYLARNKRKLSKLIKEKRIDLVDCHDPQALAWAPSVTKKLGIPFIFHNHGDSSYGKPKFSLLRLPGYILGVLRESNKANIDFVLANNNSKKAMFLTDKSFYVPNPIVGMFPSFSPNKRTGSSKGLVIGQVATFSGNKNQLFSIALLRRIREDYGINAELRLIGEPNESGYLGKLTAAASGLPVSFLPPDSDQTKFYREIDLAVFPSVSEGFGVVVLEAMSAGVPVISSDSISEYLELGMLRRLPLDIKEWCTYISSFAFHDLEIDKGKLARLKEKELFYKVKEDEYNLYFDRMVGELTNEEQKVV